jgi:hypothetical protein
MKKLTAEIIANARDRFRTYTFGGDLPGTALEIRVRNGGKSKRAYFRYNGKPFGEKQHPTRLPLGDFNQEGLTALLRKRAACEQLMREGKNPKQEHKRAEKQKQEQQLLSQRTLGQALEDFFNYARGVKWKSKHTIDLNEGIKRNHLDGHPALMGKPLAQVTAVPDMYSLISPFWHGHYVSQLPHGSPKSNGKGIAVRMRSLLHSTFENEINEGRLSGQNPCSWKSSSPLSKKLGAKPISVPHVASELEDLQRIVRYIVNSDRGRAEGYITSAEVTDWTGKSDIALRKYRNAGLLHPIKMPDRLWKNAPYAYAIEEVRRVFKDQLKRPEPLLRERDEIAIILDIILFTAFTAVRPRMATFLRWRNINEAEGYIEYLAAKGDLPAEHKTGHDGVSVYLVVLTDNLRAIIERARQHHACYGIEIKDDGYVFVHGRNYDGINRWFTRPVRVGASNTAFKKLTNRVDGIKKKGAVISGIRGTIAKWAPGKHNVDCINLALGHIIEAVRQNRTNKHYFYGIDLLKERRKMMTHWENTLLHLPIAPSRTAKQPPIAPSRTGKVIPIGRRSASA